LVLLALALIPGGAQAQEASEPREYVGAQGRYRLAYAPAWQVRKQAGATEAAFYASPATKGPALATLVVTPLPDRHKDLTLTTQGALDSLWLSVRQLPKAHVLRIDQRNVGFYDEVRYDYTYAPAPASPGRTHVVGRRVWRGGYEYRVEYRADTGQDPQYLADGRQLVESFAFTGVPIPSRRYSDQLCDDKMYGIAAMRRHNGQWEDDCRSIHEFSTSDPTEPPVVHRRVLPFQSYALAKGFDNCLYSVTKAPTDTPEYVYRYNPATRRGGYTAWKLPAQGPDNSWISAATDDRGNLLFLTSDGNKLVKVSPYNGTVTVEWTTDPLQQTPYYPAIGFQSAGTHGNFCLDDGNTMYEVYSTDGSLLKIDLKTHKPSPDMMPLDGLPRRGGYSDLLMQNDPAGRRRLYMAGPRGLYLVDLAKRRAQFVRRGTYTDLAGCNLFRVPPRPAPAPPPPAKATWKGRLLDAVTYQPLPLAQLRLELAGNGTGVLPNAQGAFAYTTQPGRTYTYRAQLVGYFPTDSTWITTPGPTVQDILLRPLTVGATLQLNNVRFEQGQAVLLTSSFPALNKLVHLMIDNPHVHIELRGHTDNVGPPEKNVVLSEQRVAAVKAYLVARGVDEGRIVGIGFGGSQPAASNDDEATRQLNRRVEFRITNVN